MAVANQKVPAAQHLNGRDPREVDAGHVCFGELPDDVLKLQSLEIEYRSRLANKKKKRRARIAAYEETREEMRARGAPRSVWTRAWITRRIDYGIFNKTMEELRVEDPAAFKKMIHLPIEMFDETIRTNGCVRDSFIKQNKITKDTKPHEYADLFLRADIYNFRNSHQYFLFNFTTGTINQTNISF